MQNAQIVYRESHTERLFFTTAPDHDTRLALRAAGWKYDRMGWFRNHNQTQLIKPKEVEGLCTVHQPETAEVV